MNADAKLGGGDLGARALASRRYGCDDAGNVVQSHAAADWRSLPSEVPVALSFNGSTQAVMMATPAALEDFAYGFALTEGIATPAEIDEVTLVQDARGIDLQLWIAPQAEARLRVRRRSMLGPVGCGLCGIESLEQALRPLPAVARGSLRVSPKQVMAAIAALPQHQPLHDQTRAAHCAAFWCPELVCDQGAGDGIVAAREDVGRHNALDKLAGHLIRAKIAADSGAVLLTCRVSTDMVQKVAALGAGLIIAVSAPTADAVALAQQLQITLIGLARPDRFELFADIGRLSDDPLPSTATAADGSQ